MTISVALRHVAVDIKHGTSVSDLKEDLCSATYMFTLKLTVQFIAGKK